MMLFRGKLRVLFLFLAFFTSNVLSGSVYHSLYGSKAAEKPPEHPEKPPGQVRGSLYHELYGQAASSVPAEPAKASNDVKPSTSALSPSTVDVKPSTAPPASEPTVAATPAPRSLSLKSLSSAQVQKVSVLLSLGVPVALAVVKILSAFYSRFVASYRRRSEGNKATAAASDSAGIAATESDEEEDSVDATAVDAVEPEIAELADADASTDADSGDAERYGDDADSAACRESSSDGTRPASASKRRLSASEPESPSGSPPPPRRSPQPAPSDAAPEARVEPGPPAADPEELVAAEVGPSGPAAPHARRASPAASPGFARRRETSTKAAAVAAAEQPPLPPAAQARSPAPPAAAPSGGPPGTPPPPVGSMVLSDSAASAALRLSASSRRVPETPVQTPPPGGLDGSGQLARTPSGSTRRIIAEEVAVVSSPHSIRARRILMELDPERPDPEKMAYLHLCAQFEKLDIHHTKNKRKDAKNRQARQEKEAARFRRVLWVSAAVCLASWAFNMQKYVPDIMNEAVQWWWSAGMSFVNSGANYECSRFDIGCFLEMATDMWHQLVQTVMLFVIVTVTALLVGFVPAARNVVVAVFASVTVYAVLGCSFSRLVVLGLLPFLCVLSAHLVFLKRDRQDESSREVFRYLLWLVLLFSAVVVGWYAAVTDPRNPYADHNFIDEWLQRNWLPGCRSGDSG